MAKKEDIGYVYIFTNESFREGWIKIGKTKNIKKRLNDLDNTSCPLPFDVYATLKTNRYEDAETFVHEFISHFNRDLRVRPNREYFKVSPKEALEILYQVKRLMNEEGSEITVYDQKSSKSVKQLEKKYSMHNGKVGGRGQLPVTQSSTPNEDAKVWLITYDKAYFDVEKCFNDLGQIYWRHRKTLKRVRKGDTAYLYGANPDKAIKFKVEIIDSQIPYSPIMDVEDKYSKIKNNSDNSNSEFFIVKLVGTTTSDALKLHKMQKMKYLGKRVNTMELSKKEYSDMLDYHYCPVKVD